MEIPLLKAIQESTDYTEEQVRNYAIQGMKVGQITFTNKNDRNLPVMSNLVLKGCRDLNKSQKKGEQIHENGSPATQGERRS